MSHDKEMKSALFLQMSMVNHAIGLFARSFDGHLIDCPGSLGTTSFVISQLAATGVVVYGDMNAALRAIGWGWVGFTWLYNVMFLFALALICDRSNLSMFISPETTCKRLFATWTEWMERWRMLLNRCKMWMEISMVSAIPFLILIWSTYACLCVKVQQQ